MASNRYSNKRETFSSFTDINLYSKKEWFFSNNLVFYMGFIVPFIVCIFFYDIFRSYKKIKKNKAITLIIIVGISYLLADFLSCGFHCFYVDSSYSRNKYKKEDGYIIVDTKYGYGSCHHIFPSNWKDVKDSTILISVVIISTIPILSVLFMVKNPVIKITLYTIIFFFIISFFIHKYTHEKLHGRDVPFFIDFFLENNLFLSPKNHQKHHIENNYNWSLFNGRTDSFFNFIIYFVCYYFNVCPIEETEYNVKSLERDDNNNIVNIKFVGDIEGTLQCIFKNNLFIKPPPR